MARLSSRSARALRAQSQVSLSARSIASQQPKTKKPPSSIATNSTIGTNKTSKYPLIGIVLLPESWSSVSSATSVTNKPARSIRMSPAPTSDVTQIRQRLSKLLQLHGYSACREALVLLVDYFTRSTKYETAEQFVSMINQVVTFDMMTDNSIIDSNLAHSVIKKMKQNDTAVQLDDAGEHQLQPLNIRVKNVEYNQKPAGRGGSELIGVRPVGNNIQANEFNIHYDFLLKRLESLPVFQDNPLTNLKSLNESSQPTVKCICFGLLVKDISKINMFMLIDSTGRVPVKITPETNFRNKIAYSNCIVLIEGVYANPDDILYAANIGLPPVLLDPIQDKLSDPHDEKMIVVLREIFLDDEDVCKYARTLFKGYNSMEDPPALFILIGDFTRDRYKDASEYRQHTKKLLRIIMSCENLANCHFVFLPGPNDTSLEETPKAMPKQPLSKEQMPINMLQLNQFKNLHLATNPAHIFLGERQISVISHSYLKELHKNLLHDLSDHREEFLENAKHIILSNAHFSAGITKIFSSSMSLWHRPDLLILADAEAFGKKFDYNSSRQSDTSFTTIPSFSRQYNQFRVYYMKSGKIEDSQVSSNAMDQFIEDDCEEKMPDNSNGDDPLDQMLETID